MSIPIVLAALAVALAPAFGHSAHVRAGGTVTPTSTSAACPASLTLTLQPGHHWPGSTNVAIPPDLPPGPVLVALPLYPGATPTRQKEVMPSFSTPAISYMKSASVTYDSPAGQSAIMSWYRKAFKECGYTQQGTERASGPKGSSEGFEEDSKLNGDQFQVALSFAADGRGGTLILYVAILVTPARYPVAGSVLRVPGTPVSLTIIEYSGMNPGPIHAVRQVRVNDVSVASSLAHAINHLPKPLGGPISCPMDDGSHDSLVFDDADGSTHVVYIGLRGCQVVLAPPAPSGSVWDDRTLLPTINKLLLGPGSTVPPLPFDARNLRIKSARKLGAVPSRFLSLGQNGSHALYVSGGNLYMSRPSGDRARLLAHGATDGALGTNDSAVIASWSTLRTLRVLTVPSRHSMPIYFPAGARLVAHTAGAWSPTVSDTLTCDPTYIWFTDGRRFEGIDAEHPADRASSGPFLPTAKGTLLAISCFGDEIAIYQPGHGLTVRNPGHEVNEAGPIHLYLPLRRISFLSWAPDERHLAYRIGSEISVLDVRTGRSRAVLSVGSDRIEGAAWDPYSRVLALSLSPSRGPVSSARVALINADGSGIGSLALPFSGATRLVWAPWHGTTLGITQQTASGPQAWTVSLPGSPPDPAVGIGMAR